MSQHPRTLFQPLWLAAAVLVLGCGGDGSDGGTPPPTTTIAKAATNSGDAQNGVVGQPLGTPLRVQVTEGGTPASGVTVAWSTTATGGSVDPTSAPTDANGIASTTWTLGTVSGSQTAQATLTGATGSPLSFSATAAPGGAATLSAAAGDGQAGQINTVLADPVQARAADQFGNGVPGVAVNWSAVGGVVSSGTVATDGSGISSVGVTLGGTAGPITITAVAAGLSGSPVMFTATAVTAPAPTTTIQVVNNAFNPSSLTVAAGSTVTWSWSATAQNHNVVPDGTIPTASGNPVDGPNTYQFRFDTPGTYRYHCTVHGGPGGVGMSGTVVVQ
jgi:plastocyanin